MPVPMLAIAAATQIPKFVAGISQLSKANKALKALGQEKYPDYTTSPEMMNAYNRAEAMSKYGYSPEERAAFDQQLARGNTAAFQAARDNGGAYYNNNVDAINQFAGKGAELRRDNMRYADDLAQRLQSQKNLQTQNAIVRRQMLEQSYGQAKSSALGNITGAAASVGAMGFQSFLGGNRGMVTEPVVDETIVEETIIDEPNASLQDFDYSNNPDN